MNEPIDQVPPGLPPCVREVATAADRLREALFNTPFPDLDDDPPDETQLQAIVHQVISWSWAVCSAYGEVDTNSGFEAGLLSLFSRPAGRQVRIRIDERPTAPLGYNRAHVIQMPASGSLDRAADVLGDPPGHLLDSCARFWPQLAGSVHSGKLASRRGTAPIQPTLQNWPEVRAMLRERYQVATFKALGLIDWVRARISGLEEAAYPRIEGGDRDERERCTVQVQQAGGSRTVSIARGQAAFLAELARDGEASIERGAKSDLVHLIPELRPWIQGTRRPSNLGQNFSTYRIPDRLRPRISFK